MAELGNTVTGRVLDESGAAIGGAAVVVDGNTVAADSDGLFRAEIESAGFVFDRELPLEMKENYVLRFVRP